MTSIAKSLQLLTLGCTTLKGLPLDHSDGVFFSVLQHYAARIACGIQTLNKLDHYQDYQAICAVLRGGLESAIDVELLTNVPSDAQKVRDWEWCSKAKIGDQAVSVYGSNVPTEFVIYVRWANANRQKIALLKNKNNWGKKTPNYWHNMKLEDAAKKATKVSNNPIYLKAYVMLYSISNWGIHGSGAIIQTTFSPQNVNVILYQYGTICCCLAEITMYKILAHPKIGFWSGDLKREYEQSVGL
jgi:hypothetical protein